MHISMALRTETAKYGALAEQFRNEFAEVDDETLADTLEGLSDLPDILHAIVRSCLLDEALAQGLKCRMADVKDRLDRFVERASRKREVVLASMVNAGMTKLHTEDFSVSVRTGPPKVDVFDEAKLSEQFLIPQPSKVDRGRLLTALKCGEMIEGVALLEGQLHLQVRTK